jgi:glycine/D-amino acid oxidase-like deaminating enzyme
MPLRPASESARIALAPTKTEAQSGLKPRVRVAVLGGGLQGACVAMELASSGIRLDLYEKRDRCMSQASAQNEGKIHLGYLYANDRSLQTARTMAKGGVAFAPLMRRWIGDGIDRIPASAPFHYVVHRESLLTIGEIDRHFQRSHDVVLDESNGARLDYFGADYRVPPTRISESDSDALFDGRNVAAAYRTQEMSIDPDSLAAIIRNRLSADPGIQCLLGAHVHGVIVDDGDMTIDFEISGIRSRERYDHVVNALWDGRLAVDKTVGLQYAQSWLYRVKHYLRVRAPDVASSLPSATIVLGAFGDVVTYSNGTLYLSWYPAGMRGASSELSPPAWPLVLDTPTSIEMRNRILDGLRKIVPSINRLTNDTIESCRVNAGIIFAWGTTDISDPASGCIRDMPSVHNRAVDTTPSIQAS